METWSSKDVAVVQTKISNKSTLLISAYFGITSVQVIPEALHKALIYANSKNLGVIIAADTNCHSSTFGPDTKKRGEQLELFIVQYNLQVENNSHDPTYESRGAAICIDITLTTRLAVTVSNEKSALRLTPGSATENSYKMLSHLCSKSRGRNWK